MAKKKKDKPAPSKEKQNFLGAAGRNMKLVIAEKPSVAMALASVLGARTRKDGYVEGNGYIVSWCVGHLVGLCDASEYDEKYKKWRYEDLPIVPECWKHKILEGTKKQFGILKKLMRDSKVDEVICATDAGREGELIFRLVYEQAGCRKEVVKTEIEDNDNNNLTIPQVVNRLGMVFFLLFFNLGITIFVFLLTGMMLFSQILFIIFAMFLPISFLLSMIPSYESMAKQAIVRVFNTIMTRAGITLIVTVAFSISSMFYNISTDYPFFMVAFLQIVCFAGIYMKLGDLMSMFSLNAGDSQNMGRRIFRRPYLFMRHRARRMERRLAGAVTAGGVAGAVAGSTISNRKPTRNTATKDSRGNTSTSSMGQRAGSKVGAVLDTKNKVKDKANAVKENIKDMPTQTAYAVYSAKEKAKSSVSDFKRGMVQEQQSRQTGRLEKQRRLLHRTTCSGLFL